MYKSSIHIQYLQFAYGWSFVTADVYREQIRCLDFDNLSAGRDLTYIIL